MVFVSRLVLYTVIEKGVSCCLHHLDHSCVCRISSKTASVVKFVGTNDEVFGSR